MGDPGLDQACREHEAQKQIPRRGITGAGADRIDHTHFRQSRDCDYKREADGRGPRQWR